MEMSIQMMANTKEGLRIFVGDIPQDCDEEKLLKVFTDRFKSAYKADLKISTSEKGTRRYAFIRFLDEHDLSAALNDKIYIDGSLLITKLPINTESNMQQIGGIRGGRPYNHYSSQQHTNHQQPQRHYQNNYHHHHYQNNTTIHHDPQNRNALPAPIASNAASGSMASNSSSSTVGSSVSHHANHHNQHHKSHGNMQRPFQRAPFSSLLPTHAHHSQNIIHRNHHHPHQGQNRPHKGHSNSNTQAINNSVIASKGVANPATLSNRATVSSPPNFTSPATDGHAPDSSPASLNSCVANTSTDLGPTSDPCTSVPGNVAIGPMNIDTNARIGKSFVSTNENSDNKNLYSSNHVSNSPGQGLNSKSCPSDSNTNSAIAGSGKFNPTNSRHNTRLVISPSSHIHASGSQGAHVDARTAYRTSFGPRGPSLSILKHARSIEAGTSIYSGKRAEGANMQGLSQSIQNDSTQNEDKTEDHITSGTEHNDKISNRSEAHIGQGHSNADKTSTGNTSSPTEKSVVAGLNARQGQNHNTNTELLGQINANSSNVNINGPPAHHDIALQHPQWSCALNPYDPYFLYDPMTGVPYALAPHHIPQPHPQQAHQTLPAGSGFHHSALATYSTVGQQQMDLSQLSLNPHPSNPLNVASQNASSPEINAFAQDAAQSTMATLYPSSYQQTQQNQSPLSSQYTQMPVQNHQHQTARYSQRYNHQAQSPPSSSFSGQATSSADQLHYQFGNMQIANGQQHPSAPATPTTISQTTSTPTAVGPGPVNIHQQPLYYFPNYWNGPPLTYLDATGGSAAGQPTLSHQAVGLPGSMYAASPQTFYQIRTPLPAQMFPSYPGGPSSASVSAAAHAQTLCQYNTPPPPYSSPPS